MGETLLFLLLLLNGQIKNFPLNTYVLIHRLMLHPAFIREVPYCSGWWLTQKPVTGQSVR